MVILKKCTKRFWRNSQTEKLPVIPSWVSTVCIFLLLLCLAGEVSATAPLLPPAGVSETINSAVIVDSITSEGAKGSLYLKLDSAGETVKLGPATRQYAVGIALDPSAFSTELAEVLKGYQIIQIMIGKLPENGVESSIASLKPFGTIAVITKEIPVKERIYKTVFGPTSKKHGEHAQVSFNRAPNGATDPKLSDEDKLKSTYFAQAGTLVFRPEGVLEKVKVKSKTGYLAFTRQKVVIELNVLLSTPFNPVEGDGKGRVELYVYQASQKEARELTRDLVNSTINQLFSTRSEPTTGVSTNSVNRAVSGSSRK